jgi:drug/metabolite transporter (DMT)-like permease
MKIRIKEAEVNKEDELVSQLKSQMSSLIRNMDTTLTAKTKEQKEGVLTVASVAIALPAILGLIAKFGKAATNIVNKVIGKKPTEQGDVEKYFQQMGRVADELHHLYMKPLEILMKKFIKDPAKAQKVAHFIFHVIIGLMLLSAGVTAFKAIQSKNLSLATLETALASIKGGEIKNYISKLIA